MAPSPWSSQSRRLIRPRSARLPPKPTLRRGSPITAAGYSPKTSRAAGFAAQAPVEATVAAAQDSPVVFVARSQPLARWVEGNSERKVAFLRPSGGGSCQLLVALRGL